MLPTRTEVVLVADLDLNLAAKYIPDPDIFLLADLFQAVRRVAVLPAVDAEYMQVIASPAEQDLNYLVQVTKREERRYDNAAPDRRPDVLELHLELHGLADGQRRSGRD